MEDFLTVHDGITKLNTKHLPKTMQIFKSNHLISTFQNEHLESLPQEVLLLIFSYLQLKDLVNMRSTCDSMRNIIDNCPYLYAVTSCRGLWPSKGNFQHFERAANCGNIEAKIKLAVCYLYRDRISGSHMFDSENGCEWAAELFTSIDRSCSSQHPFSWIFYRPPWVNYDNACKAKVFRAIKEILRKSIDSERNRAVMFSVARTLELSDFDGSANEAFELYKKASSLDCPYSSLAYFNEKVKHVSDVYSSDVRNSIERLRRLNTMYPKCTELRYCLCEIYIDGKCVSLPTKRQAAFVSKFFASSKALNIDKVFLTNQYFTSYMRYILLDWIAEVVNMKMLSCLTFHLAVRLVDRYLSSCQCSRNILQLAGIASLLLATRYACQEVLTIREASWLTDNTYHYREVMLMMAEIVTTVRGQIRVITVLDYVELLLKLQKPCSSIRNFSYYLSELSMFYTEALGQSEAAIACSCVILAMIFVNRRIVWDKRMVNFTGFTIKQLTEPVLRLYDRCFRDKQLLDMNNQSLHAVKDKYKEDHMMRVSLMAVPERSLVCHLLQVDDGYLIDVDSKFGKLTTDVNLEIRSPSSKNRFLKPYRSDGDAAVDKVLVDISTPSNFSGYDGDDECEHLPICDARKSLTGSGRKDSENVDPTILCCYEKFAVKGYTSSEPSSSHGNTGILEGIAAKLFLGVKKQIRKSSRSYCRKSNSSDDAGVIKSVSEGRIEKNIVKRVRWRLNGNHGQSDVLSRGKGDRIGCKNLERNYQSNHPVVINQRLIGKGTTLSYKKNILYSGSRCWLPLLCEDRPADTGCNRQAS